MERITATLCRQRPWPPLARRARPGACRCGFARRCPPPGSPRKPAWVPCAHNPEGGSRKWLRRLWRSSRMVEKLLHIGPPRSVRARLIRLLARVCKIPPVARDGICGHFSGVGSEIHTVIFPIGEQQHFRLAKKNAEVSDVAGGDRRKHAGPSGCVQALVFLGLL